MTANPSNQANEAAVKVAGVLRWVLLIVGGLAVVLGIVMILNPFTTATVLAIIIGISLVLNGILDLVDHRYASKGLSIAAGLICIVAGVLVMAWPDATLWVIAVIVGISFLARGMAQVVVGLSAEARRDGVRGLMLVSGAISIVIGVISLVWPDATIFVLAVIFGIQVLVVGLLEVGAGVMLGKAESAATLPN